MKRVNNIEVAVGVLDNHIMHADENEFGMRHRVLPAIRGADDGTLAGGQVLANQVAIHVD